MHIFYYVITKRYFYDIIKNAKYSIKTNTIKNKNHNESLIERRKRNGKNSNHI